MDEIITDAPAGAPATGRYGRTLLVACGWYGTVVAGAVVGTLSVPSAPPTDCSGFGACLSPGGRLTIGLLFGVPAGIVLVALTALVAAGVVRRVESAIRAGTLATAVSVSVAAVAVAAYAGTR